MEGRSFVTRYTISADGLRIKEPPGQVVKKDLYASVLTPLSDSPRTRAEIFKSVLDRIDGVVLNPKGISISLGGMVRADLNVFTDSFDLSDPLPTARAKVVVRLNCPVGDLQAYDGCVLLEEALDRELQSSKVGFVDGHDVGQGEFCIYAIGPKKKPLRDAVDNFLQHHPRLDARLK